MNVKELKDKLEELIQKGYGEYPVYIDESIFSYHRLKSVSLIEDDGLITEKGVYLE